MKNKQAFKHLIIATCVSFGLSGCVIHVGGGNGWDIEDGEVSSVFGDVSVGEGKYVSHVSSVNGDVTLEDRVTVDHLSSVNGDIDIGEHVTADGVDVVNGDIEIGEHFTNQNGVNSVNGDIDIAEHANINGLVKTVNGDIEIKSGNIDNDIVTTNGDISLLHGSHVTGNIVYEQNSKNYWGSDEPKLVIDAKSRVDGEIILHRPVKLEFANPELQSKVRRYFGE
ncbi:hypothetical protein [Alteromonas facilis]|uniref:hypothetical protein n=1 Tax=Alteromonas facilis TaxID=2048004 RepID=UPI000C2934FE|nr:hypothetical protein [Alteromonas facilis]